MRPIDGQDKPERLYVLDLGLFQVNDNNRIIGIPGFLVRLHSGANILIDSGFPADYAQDEPAASKRDRLSEFGHLLKFGSDNLVGSQLGKIGLKPADIDLFILTHSHIDHVGGLNEFPTAIFAIGAAERALPKPLYWGDRHPLDWPSGPRIEIVSDYDICNGLRILSTPGHTPGHLSILVELRRTGSVLLTGDAISRATEFDDGFEGWHPEMAEQQARRLKTLAQELGAFVIYGHDPAQWPQLRKAPDHYD